MRSDQCCILFWNLLATIKKSIESSTKLSSLIRKSYREHYEHAAQRIEERLAEGAKAGELRSDIGEIEAWAIMGMNVFLGLRYGIWSEEKSAAEIAEIANGILARGITADKGPG